MLLTPRVKFLLGTVLAVSLLTLLVAAYSPHDAKTESQVSVPTLKSKILRRKDRLKEKPNAFEKALLRKQAEVQPKREVEDAIPQHVPLKIKLKREKEARFKDVNNVDWMRDFELEVTNTSNKPIYFLSLWLELPDTKSESGYPLAIPLHYGRAAFVNSDTRPMDQDVPLLPGQTHTFKVEERYERAWRRGKARNHLPDPRKVKFVFVHLSFGNGTGFYGGDAEIYPHVPQQSNSCRDGTGQLVRRISTPSDPPLARFVTKFSGYMPAIMPAKFFISESISLPDLSSRPDLNCPGTDCIFAKPDTYSCSCSSEAVTYQIVESGDPKGKCQKTLRNDFWCSEYDVGCTQWNLYACGSQPSPTPTPTPSPSPTPTPTPTPCPAGSFDPNPDGSCPLNSNKINGCCVCQERNTNCERFGQGTLGDTPYCQWVEELCDCYNLDGRCADNPRPLVTPTPTGGGDENQQQPPPQPCTHYYWVEYVSYDGGETWQEVDRWYAGCW